MIREVLALCDEYGTDLPAFNEGHPEDRCPICGRPVVDHTIHGGITAKWPHRRAVLFSALVLCRLP
ncbi:Uncharacterised protein [Mycobacteroides abscessus subsp. bolletii]|nr:Uncharacterised protein [Mycobacteroides abscessus subsp. bolletii]SKG56823.1 Uncharacterised protein [Mycobacteroides abscessus subsp. bolletii]SKG82974.1 Uncharacterised protein [Mycobacteroides abscessus subsp. bolletii]SKG94391.1 Uncharacterised protein [Mycobacteroides abscessus subsp. bolletii]SKH25719.1 Uncharacterised protein [Mycobacteroides abscessus subsp. bolletii]